MLAYVPQLLVQGRLQKLDVTVLVPGWRRSREAWGGPGGLRSWCGASASQTAARLISEQGRC